MAYTYLIGWSKYNTWYYGSRYAKDSKPTDLWVSYFTSSKYVKDFADKNGAPDIIQIRRIFNDPNKARIWEHKVLKRLKVTSNSKFLNQTDNISISSEAALKGSLKSTNKGQTRPHLSKLNKEKIGAANPMFGRVGDKAPAYGRVGHLHPMFGKKNPIAAEAAKRTIACPTCNKVGNIANMKRWHFDNCKFNVHNKKENKHVMGQN